MELLNIPQMGSFNQVGGTLSFSMPTDAMLNVILEPAIKYMDVVGDSLGLYQTVRTDRHGEAKFSRLSAPKHVLQAAKDCETWNPKGKMSTSPETVKAYAYEFMGEHCNDVFVDCMRYIKGTGTEANDLTATPEGNRMLAMMTQQITTAIGNSVFDVVSYSNHAYITTSDSNTYYDSNDITATEWSDYKDQQTSQPVRGHITLIEDYKAAGNAQYRVALDASDFAGDKFVGGSTDTTITDLLDRVIAASPTKLRTFIKRNQSSQSPLILVSNSIFDAYEKYVITTFKQIPEVYRFFVQGQGTILEPIAGVLKYGKYWVVCMDEWGEFDAITGATTHRAILTIPGNFGVAYDVENLNQFGGAGLIIQTDPSIKAKGKVYMYTKLELGATIIEPDYLVNASLIVNPS